MKNGLKSEFGKRTGKQTQDYKTKKILEIEKVTQTRKFQEVKLGNAPRGDS